MLSLVESRHELPAWVVAEGNAGVVWLHVPLADRTDQEVLSVFAATNAFIDRGRREGTVLVHCRAGVSRSAAVVVGTSVKSRILGLAALAPPCRADRPWCVPHAASGSRGTSVPDV